MCLLTAKVSLKSVCLLQKASQMRGLVNYNACHQSVPLFLTKFLHAFLKQGTHNIILFLICFLIATEVTKQNNSGLLQCI